MSDDRGADGGRQAGLKAIIRKLHDGMPASAVKREFAGLIKGVSAGEVAAMEQALIDEGFPVEEVQRLCEVHVEVFENELRRGGSPKRMPGHPVHTFMAENREAARRVSALVRAAWAWRWWGGGRDGAAAALSGLAGIVVHYARKENQLFPFLERVGFTGPSKVMWGKHDEIRAQLKDAEAALGKDAAGFLKTAKSLASSIRRMIFMEERILLPNALSRLDARDWAAIRAGEGAIGYAWVRPGAEYDAAIAASASPARSGGAAPSGTASSPADGIVELGVGRVPLSILDLALKRLSVDISIVDADDRVLYYSDSPDRVFPRSPGVIGRSVQNCHPQKSVATVQRILESFRKKERDSALFWIRMGGRFVVIEYRALYDGAGNYRGTLEISQDAAGIRAMEGERRLLDW
ncbi:MAG: DUF438 domain-containing protein [Spirochaetes bacterium]|nr:DUF438 domain-containing protein [Spirochaetota bacterium]